MNEDLQKLIESKKNNDKKQRTISLAIVFVSLTLIIIIFYSITQKQKTNQLLQQSLDTTKVTIQKHDSIVLKLEDTLTKVRTNSKKDIIECIGIPLGTKTRDGLPMYSFTLRIKETSIITKVLSVDYFFDHPSYQPKLKKSNTSKNNFSIVIANSWGCMNTVPVYIHYKNNKTDTVIFKMCEKIRIQLPKI